MKKESEFQSQLMDEIRLLLPGCIILKNDATYIQGISDWSIYYGPKFAMLECKRSANERHQPNQDYYVDKINKDGGFARFVYPENKTQVLLDLVHFMRS